MSLDIAFSAALRLIAKRFPGVRRDFKEAQEENIKVIFAQPQFSTKSAETIAQEIGGKVLLIAPLAQDWSNNLLQVSQTFAEVFQKEGNRN